MARTLIWKKRRRRVYYDARYRWDWRCDRSAVDALRLAIPRVTRGLVALARA